MCATTAGRVKLPEAGSEGNFRDPLARVVARCWPQGDGLEGVESNLNLGSNLCGGFATSEPFKLMNQLPLENGSQRPFTAEEKDELRRYLHDQ
jgi:hypothetical protein